VLKARCPSTGCGGAGDLLPTGMSGAPRSCGRPRSVPARKPSQHPLLSGNAGLAAYVTAVAIEITVAEQTQADYDEAPVTLLSIAAVITPAAYHTLLWRARNHRPSAGNVGSPPNTQSQQLLRTQHLRFARVTIGAQDELWEAFAPFAFFLIAYE
jgi:hypothetical protein